MGTARMLSRAFSQQRMRTSIKTTDTDPYFGHKSIATAVAKYINESPVLRRRRPRASEPFSNTPLDIYIACIIYKCGVPNIVPYATLYLLAAISRTCNCGTRFAGSDSEASYNADCDGSSKSPSTFSHRLSQLAKNPIKQLRRPLWTPHHFFTGALLIVLREYQNGYSPSTLAEISGVKISDLVDLHVAISFCLNRDTALALSWMIKESEFRSLNDVECPVVVSRRKRLAKRKKNHDDDEHRSHLGRVFSFRRSRRNSSSSETSFRSHFSTVSWIASLKSSGSP